MDLLHDLRLKIESLKDHPAASGLQAVLRHIEIAERHLRRGVVEQDGDLFNDAIYRANQAYEGVLKEACDVAGGGSKGKRTHQLEEELRDSRVITPRAKKVLENYRQEWRNPATHVHTLFFGEQDAFLAIVTVLGLVSVIVDHVVEMVAAGDQERDLLTSPPPRREEDEPLSQRLHRLVEEYSKRPHAFFREDKAPRSENELIGRLSAFLRGSDDRMALERQPLLGEGLRPDLMIRDGEERVIVEVKRIVEPQGISPGLQAQLLEYLRAAGLKFGILLIPPSAPGRPLVGHVDIYRAPNDELYSAMVFHEPEWADENLG